jgi:hypothetical protein
VATKKNRYDFGEDPVSVNLNRPNLSIENKETHRIRKPSQKQWYRWGFDIYEQRRYLSQQELTDENQLADHDDEVESAYERQYDEYDASRDIYLKNAVDVTTYKLDETGELRPYKTYDLTSDFIDKVIGKDVVISGLYSCYCQVAAESLADLSDEIRVNQTIGRAEDSPVVIHVLGKPTEDLTRRLQSEITRKYLVHHKPDTVRICLNLPAVKQIYNAMILRIENATVGDSIFSEDTKEHFLEAVNPVFKLKVLEATFDRDVWHFNYD